MFIGGGVILSQDDVAILRKGLAANWSMNNIKRDGKENRCVRKRASLQHNIIMCGTFDRLNMNET